MSTERDAEKPRAEDRSLDRRRFVALCGAMGIGATAAPQLLAAAEKEKGKITRGDLTAVEDLTGLHFSDPERELMLQGLEEQRQGYGRLRKVVLDNSVPPALRFDPAPPERIEIPEPKAFRISDAH